MAERTSFENEIPEGKKYELPEENIIELDENSELLKKLPEPLRNLPWPMEIQGSGHTYEDKKEFKIWYPKGDTFLSMATVIHELGHLRQAEINPGIDPEKKFINTAEHNEADFIREKDAYRRGWERAKAYCPEMLRQIENEFATAKGKGKMAEFDNFQGLYDYFTSLGLKINQLYSDFDSRLDENLRKKFKHEDPNITEEGIESKMEEEMANYVAERIRNDEIFDFFKNIDKLRIGKKIDSEFARKFIKQTAEKIAEEKY